MIDEKRIKEAESNLREYLRENLIIETKNETAKAMYIENSDLSLKTAEKLLEIENKDYRPYLWIIVTSYYAMYYIANAVLLNLGYKIGHKISHKVTADALIVFVRHKLKKELLEEYENIKEDAMELISSKIETKVNDLIKSFDFELEKRSKFQYQMDESIKKTKALTSLDRAKRFSFEIGKLL